MPFDSARLDAAKGADLLSLAGRHTSLKKVSACGGGEYAGPCPICGGGRDRFRVQLNHKGRGPRWYCRICGDGYWHDVIDFQKSLTGQSPAEAIRELAGGTSCLVPARHVAAQPVPNEPSGPPGEAWQNRAKALIAEAQVNLWAPAGAPARAWLAARGLIENTIRRAQLGYLPEARRECASAWGLDGKDVYMPAGIVIPCEVAGVMWNLTVRRRDSEIRAAAARGQKLDKLLPPRGMRPALYLADWMTGAPAVVLAEGQFDALLLWQEAHDLADVVTLGGASYRLNVGEWGTYFVNSRIRILAHDADAAGDRGAEGLAWLGGSRRARPPALQPTDKDLTDYHRSGGNLRAWLAQCLGTDSRNAPGSPQAGQNDSRGSLVCPAAAESPSGALRAALGHPGHLPGLPMAQQPEEVEEVWWDSTWIGSIVEGEI